MWRACSKIAVGALAEALHPHTVSKQKEWLTKNCRELKHEKGKAAELLHLMKEVKQEKSHSKHQYLSQFTKVRLL